MRFCCGERPSAAATAFQVLASSGEERLCDGLPAMTMPQQKERRTKAAPEAPAKGHEKRTLADAPIEGRGFKALLSQLKLGGFSGSSVLTLTRQFKLSLARGQRLLFYAITGLPANRFSW